MCPRYPSGGNPMARSEGPSPWLWLSFASALLQRRNSDGTGDTARNAQRGACTIQMIWVEVLGLVGRSVEMMPVRPRVPPHGADTLR